MKAFSWKQAWLPLAALTAMNLLNYIDRFVVTALLPEIQQDLGINDAQSGLLGAAFIVVYFLACPLFGWVGDRGSRSRWLAMGVGLWSLATAAAGLTQRFSSLFVARATVGIGEAAYGTISPSLLSDTFPKVVRGRVLSYFYMATPVGSALGYLLGGYLGARFGWRTAFYAVGLPGLLLAASALLLEDPPRGRFDEPSASPEGVRETYRMLARSRPYVWTVAGYTAYTFALGGLAFWMPTYMMRVRHYEQGPGMLMFGGITVASGLVGTLVGGWLGDRLLARTPRGYAWLNSLSMVGASVAALAAFIAQPEPLFLACLVVAQVCTFLSTGPVNALIINSVPAHARATAVATSIFCIHLFGDAISPTLIGLISDRTALTHAMLLIPGFFLVAGGLWGVLLRSDP